jgi:hypothetical protein
MLKNERSMATSKHAIPHNTMVNLRDANSNGKFIMMTKRHALRIAVLIWLGWYLSGPVCETFDFWDPPRAEVHDIQRNAGGAAVLVAAIFCFAVALIRRLREGFQRQARIGASLLSLISFLSPFVPTEPALSHSPPSVALRI